MMAMVVATTATPADAVVLAADDVVVANDSGSSVGGTSVGSTSASAAQAAVRRAQGQRWLSVRPEMVRKQAV